jgi:hypothetical protein
MIHIFQSIFLRLIFHSILLLNACYCFGFKMNDDLPGNDTMSNMISAELRFYTLANQPFQFSDSVDYFLVIKNNRNCLECFRSLNDYANTLRADNKIRFGLITLIDSATLERKRNNLIGRKLLPDFDEFIFTYSSSGGNKLTKDFNISYTPEILIISDGKIHIIHNREIFDYGTSDISAETNKKIIELFKP